MEHDYWLACNGMRCDSSVTHKLMCARNDSDLTYLEETRRRITSPLFPLRGCSRECLGCLRRWYPTSYQNRLHEEIWSSGNRASVPTVGDRHGQSVTLNAKLSEFQRFLVQQTVSTRHLEQETAAWRKSSMLLWAA